MKNTTKKLTATTAGLAGDFYDPVLRVTGLHVSVTIVDGHATIRYETDWQGTRNRVRRLQVADLKPTTVWDLLYEQILQAPDSWKTLLEQELVRKTHQLNVRPERRVLHGPLTERVGDAATALTRDLLIDHDGVNEALLAAGHTI